MDSKDLFEPCSLCENIILCAPPPFLVLHLVSLSSFVLSTFLSFLYTQLFSLLNPPIFLLDLLLLCFILLHFSSILAFLLLTHSLSYNFCPACFFSSSCLIIFVLQLLSSSSSSSHLLLFAFNLCYKQAHHFI